MKISKDHFELMKYLSTDSTMFKPGIVPEHFYEARETIAKIACEYKLFRDENKLKGYISNIIFKQEWSKSDSHPEGRAIDFHSKSWPREKKLEFISILEKLFNDEAAISKETGKKRLVLLECEGTDNEHFHCQLAKTVV